MFKRTAGFLILAACFIPGISSASYRLGAGVCMNGLISGGIEFKVFVPIAEETGIFIAPHGFGVLVDDEGGYTVGGRAGVMFRQDNWAAPYVGVGFGHSGGDMLYHEVTGGRVFAGLSFAPRMLTEALEQTSSVMRFDLDFAFSYKVINSYYDTTDEQMFFPSVGLGLSFNW